MSESEMFRAKRIAPRTCAKEAGCELRVEGYW
jgi:hypothetical protein